MEPIPAPESRSELLTLPEAAEYLRHPVGTLRDWRLRGVGPRSAKIGSRVFYRRSDLDSFIAERFDNAG